VKQQEAVQRVVQLEEALDRLEVERSELSQRLQAMASVRGGGGEGGPLATPPKAEDSGSEVRPPPTGLASVFAFAPSAALHVYLPIGSTITSRHRLCRSLRGVSCMIYDAWLEAQSVCPPAPQQQMVSPASSSQERVLTLSVPQGRERHLTGSDIKKLTWPEYISLYEVSCSTCDRASFLRLPAVLEPNSGCDLYTEAAVSLNGCV
jgi:hypothetical protein